LILIFSDCVRFVLSLRYKIDLTGLDKIENNKGVLILPNHPAEIDPVIMSIFLWRRFRPSPIVLEDFYNMPVLNSFFKSIGALPMPDMESGRSQFKLRRIDKTLDEMSKGLADGKNFLLYPSGRLTRDGREIIGGASALHTLLEKSPNANLLLARTRGLWGSSFSYAFDGKRPDLVKRTIRGIGILLMNVLFFTPRRKITIEFFENPEDFPKSSPRIEQNHWLENWYNLPPIPATICSASSTRLERRRRVFTRQAFYNAIVGVLRIVRRDKSNNLKHPDLDAQAKKFETTKSSSDNLGSFDLSAGFGDGVEPLQLVPYSRWTMKKPEIFGAKKQDSVDVSDVPESIREGVVEEFSKMTKRPTDSIQPAMQLRKDLGLDSLEMADVIDWLDMRFDVQDVALVDLTTVGAVMIIAAGNYAVSEKTTDEKTSQWGDVNNRPPVLPPEGETIQESFLRVCDRMKKCQACADNLSGVLSYKKMKISALALASVIKDLPEERIGIMLPASVGVNIIFLAVTLAGKIPVMINWTLGERNLRHVIEAAEIKTILTSMKFVDNLDNVAFDEIEDLLIFLEDLKREKINLKIKLAALYNSLKSADRLLKHLNLNSLSEEDTAVLLFTSGSEAMPKGVPLSHKNILTNARDCSAILNFTDKDVLYGFLPPFHSFGLTVTMVLPVHMGLRVSFYPNPTESRKLARGIKNWKVTIVPGTPTFLKGIINAAKHAQLNSVRIFVAGAEKAPEELFLSVNNLKTGAQLLEGYGITECSPVVSIIRPDEKPEGVGRPLDSIEVCVIDVDTHKKSPQGERGLFLVNGDSIFKGYYGKNPPDPFIESDGKLWYNTGDLGFITKTGSLIIVGRLKRFIKIGGEMISLPAIETALREKWPTEDEGNEKIAVDAKEKEGKGPEIFLFTTEDITVDEANNVLREAGFGNLSRITEVKIIDSIPLLGTGKTDYQSLNHLIIK